MAAELGPFAHRDPDRSCRLGAPPLRGVCSLWCSLCSCYFTELQAYSICTKTKSLLGRACCYERKNILKWFCFYNFN